MVWDCHYSIQMNPMNPQKDRNNYVFTILGGISCFHLLMVAIIYTLWLFNIAAIAMENDPFIDDVPMKTVIFHGYVK